MLNMILSNKNVPSWIMSSYISLSRLRVRKPSTVQSAVGGRRRLCRWQMSFLLVADIASISGRRRSVCCRTFLVAVRFVADAAFDTDIRFHRHRQTFLVMTGVISHSSKRRTCWWQTSFSSVAELFPIFWQTPSQTREQITRSQMT